MIPILDWIFEGIVNWIASIASTILDAVSGLFLEALGTDMTAMEEYFPFITKAYSTLQYTAWAILFLVVIWQLFRAFGGPITEAENPWHLVIRGAIYAFLIGYAKPIAMFCLEIARVPYTSLMEVSMTGEDFTFAGVEEVLTNGLTTIVAASTVAGLILVLILLIALGWNYFKLLLETVERYIVVGVLSYTSPLAFSMGGSKTTNNVFKSWCRMVGSQLILLVMNVWFLRGFASSMGHFIGNGGALTNGKGSIFLWMFCALAYLRCAQRFDSYLSSLGLNVAQTGSSMAMEMMMAARVVSGMGGGAKSAGSVFGGKTGSTATGTGAAASGFASGFASKFSPNSYVRDAVVDGRNNIGFGGGAGFMGRAFGGIAARNGATLNGDSISSVASRAPGVSGTIGGDIADRSLSNYMPHMQGFQMKGTQITGGHISTTAVSPDGKTSSVDMYSAAQFEKPEVPHSVVTASDGSQWYQMASGEGRGAFYDAPTFGGVSSDAVQDAAAVMDDQTVASSIGAEVEAIQQGMGAYPDGGFNGGGSEETMVPASDGPAFGAQFVQSGEDQIPGGTVLSGGSEEIQQGIPAMGQNGESAIPGEALTQGAEMPAFQQDAPIVGSSCAEAGDMPAFVPTFVGESLEENQDIPGSVPVSDHTESPLPGSPGDDGVFTDQHMDAPGFVGSVPQQEGSFYQTDPAPGMSFAGREESAPVENQSGGDHSPGYSEANLVAATFPSAQEGTSLRTVEEGVIEASNPDGSNTLWYNSAFYQEPEAPHSTMEAANGVQWYTMQSKADAPQFESGVAASAYNQATFQNFMPGYDGQVSQVDGSHRQDGHFEIRNADGSGTAFYDTARFAAPRGDYKVFEDAKGKQWYAIRGEPAVERKPVYENGQAVYDGDKLRTVTVDTVRYKQTPARFAPPKKRGDIERKPPRRKK